MSCSNLWFLVVEDHDFQRSMLEQLLRRLGAAGVRTAADGQAALQVLRDPNQPVDIIISDLQMPGMDGLEFLRVLGEIGACPPLILVSALDTGILASIANVAKAYKVKLLGVIGKPATAAKLHPLLQLHATSAEAGANESTFSLAEIEEAWAKEEFQPWFEPRVDLSGRRVAGMHVVPAWLHPSQGTLLGPQFMPAVRTRGLNDDFVWMMLEKALVSAAQWPGHALQLSFDLSLQSLANGNPPDRVRQLARDAGLEAQSILLSVSEATLNTDSARTLENLARLRMMGFDLGLGDFGSGLMAVDSLAAVAFTEVKIGSGFVTGVAVNPSQRAGLAVGLELAQQLRARAAAEGIGSKDEWTLLHEWGCEIGQGPFISTPIPGEAVPEWVNKWSSRE